MNDKTFNSKPSEFKTDFTLVNKSSPQTPSVIARLGGSQGPCVFSFGPISSALDQAWELSGAGLFPPFSSLICLSQSAGRGRMGRSWLSNPGNVYAAVKLDPKGPFAGLSAGLNLAAILAQELDELIIKKEGPKLNCQGPLVMIKWPNDLIYQGRKVGGILLENRKGELIAGVGLNLIAPPPDALSREPWAPPAGAINSDLGSAEDLWPLLAYKILISYNEYFASYGENKSLIGKANILSRLLGLGQMAEVHGPSCSPSVKIPRLFGRITGLTEEGALIMEGPDGPLTVWSGVLVLSMRNFQLHD